VTKLTTPSPEGARLGTLAKAAAWAAEGLLPELEERSLADGLGALLKTVRADGLPNLSLLLPGLFRLGRTPFSLHDHVQFEPYFAATVPPVLLMKTGRQTGKTQTLAVWLALMAALNPFYKALVVTPLSDQVRRISSDYVRPLIETSPLAPYWTGPRCDRGVWRRSLKNESILYFSFAGLTVDRIRGISCAPEGANLLDEVQDINSDHLSVIHETMSHARRPVKRYSGTPKTLENTIESLWKDSSQAEWVTPCGGCRFWNYACVDLHLEKMIGPYHEGIGEHVPGLVCARCQKPVDPRRGFWHHKRPHLAGDFPGYHIPQPIMHIHFSLPGKWRDLISKQEGNQGYTRQRFLNEVLGESAGTGVQLVSEPELAAASDLPWANDPRDPRAAAKRLKGYSHTCLAVDWGGGGEKGLSLTVVAVLGLTTSGEAHVLWGKRLTVPGHLEQALEIRELFTLFGASFIAHDFTGAGHDREVLLNYLGVSLARIIPVQYGGLAGMAYIKTKPPTAMRPRKYYLVDKTKLLQMVCHSIRMRLVRFFKYDYLDVQSPGLIRDFLALQENLIDTARGSPLYTIVRNPSLPDDFAQAVAIGCVGLWQMSGQFPDPAQREGIRRVLERLQTTESGLDADEDERLLEEADDVAGL
jgi:hypothetical protein